MCGLQVVPIIDAQLQRAYEALSFARIDAGNEEQYRKFRLWIKRRLYHENADELKQVEESVRKQKLARMFSFEESIYLSVLRSAGVPFAGDKASTQPAAGTPRYDGEGARG